MFNNSKIYLLTILILSFSLNLFSQEEPVRVVDKKIFITEKTINSIIKSENNINEKNNLDNLSKQLTQFTDNTEQDIELHAAINPTDTTNIVISWMAMEPTNASMPLLFKLFYTNNFGETWEEAEIDFMPRNLEVNEAMSGGGDPVIVFDTHGDIYISWIYTVVRVFSADDVEIDVYLTYAKSTDKGATWIRPADGDDFISSGTLDYVIPHITGVQAGNFPDKQWMSINPVNNDLFVSLAEFNTTDNYNTGIDTWGIRRKPAEQTLFEDKVLVPPDGTVWAQLGSMAIDKNGNVHAVYPYYPSFPDPPLEKLMHSISTDNGTSYSEPHFIADVDVTYFHGVGQTNTTATNMYDRLYPCSYIAIDTCSNSDYENRIYVVWNSNDDNYTKKVDVLISYSDNNGDTWSEPAIVNTDPPRNYGFHHRPTIYVNPDGILVLAWYDNRGYEVPNVYMNDYYYALSYDGGETFEEYLISDEPFDYNDDNFESTVGIGEYFQIIATKNNVIAFYAAFDGEDTEIYYNILPFGQATKISESQPITDQISITNIFPNPATDFITYEINIKKDTEFDYKIYNLKGELILTGKEQQYKTGTNKNTININNLPEGTYYLCFDTEWGVFVKKFIKVNAG